MNRGYWLARIIRQSTRMTPSTNSMSCERRSCKSRASNLRAWTLIYSFDGMNRRVEIKGTYRAESVTLTDLSGFLSALFQCDSSR